MSGIFTADALFHLGFTGDVEESSQDSDSGSFFLKDEDDEDNEENERYINACLSKDWWSGLNADNDDKDENDDDGESCDVLELHRKFRDPSEVKFSLLENESTLFEEFCCRFDQISSLEVRGT